MLLLLNLKLTPRIYYRTHVPFNFKITVKCFTSCNQLNILQPPLDEDTNGAILGYEVEYRIMGTSSSLHRKTVKAHKNSVELTGLKYYTTYEITVKAFNRVGVGPATLPIQQITTESGM